MTIRRLSPSDAKVFRTFRLHGLRESPAAFGASFEEESKLPLKVFADRLKQTESKWAFGAFDGDRLMGFVTLVRETRIKEKHKASVYGMYVDPVARGEGVGRKLIERVIDTARRVRGLRQVRLAVVEGNLPALRLYENVGFKVYGREESALSIGRRYYAEFLLALPLKAQRPNKAPEPTPGSVTLRASSR
jgi:ribosomal protein S18 acetylase RimI-like enzyme